MDMSLLGKTAMEIMDNLENEVDGLDGAEITEVMILVNVDFSLEGIPSSYVRLQSSDHHMYRRIGLLEMALDLERGVYNDELDSERESDHNDEE